MKEIHFPRNIEAELSIIATCLIDREQAEKFVDGLAPDYFYGDKNRRTYQAIKDLIDRGAPTDITAVLSELKINCETEGDAVFLSTLLNEPPIFGGIEHHVNLLREAWQRRRIIAANNKCMREAEQTGIAVDTALQHLNTTLIEVETGNRESTMASLSDLAIEVGEKIERIQKGSDLVGVKTGFSEVDRVLIALQKTNLYIIAARPGMGKTAFAMALAYNAAKAGIPVCLFSLEMSKDQLATRCLCTLAGLEVSQAMAGRFSNEDWVKFSEAQETCYELPIYFDDQAALHYTDIMRRARRMQRMHGIGLFIVDYLQLARGDREAGRVMEVASISAALKALAKELAVPVVALSQLNRGVETRPDKRPLLSDLRDSGSLEQDADAVLGLYRDSVYSQTADPNKCEVLILKHRQGPTGTVILGWHGKTMRFFNLSKRTE